MGRRKPPRPAPTEVARGPAPAPAAEDDDRDPPLLAAAVPLCALAAYALTAYPTVSGGDAGELLTISCTLGVAHPPGYPLWTWLAAGARVLGGLLAPQSRVAWRVNLLSGALDSLAAGLLFLVARRLASRCGAPLDAARAGALLASGLFAFAPGIWLYAIQSEVFALNNALVAGVMLALLRFDRRRTVRRAAVVALVSGLALSNQHTAVLFVVPYALWVVWALAREALLGPRALAVLALAALLGLSPYLHLPAATALDRESSWGEQLTLDGFLTHFLRREYGTFQLASHTAADGGEELFFTRLWIFLGNFGRRESLNLGLPLLAAGVGALALRGGGCGARVPVLAGLALYLTVMSLRANLALDEFHLGITLRMLQQPYMLMFGLAGVGFAQVSPLLPLPPAAWAAAAVAAQAAAAWPHMQHADNWAFETYGRAVLEPLPPNALLLVNEDLNVNTVTYLQQCEGVRPDVSSVPLALITYKWWRKEQLQHHPGLAFPGTRHHPRDPDEPWAAFDMATFLEHNVGKPWEVYVAGGWKEGDGSEAAFRRWPVGFADRVLAPSESYDDVERYLALAEAALPMTTPPPGYALEEWEHILSWKHVNLYKAASHYLAEHLAGPTRLRALRLAARLYELLRESHLATDGVDVDNHEVWRNAGVVLGTLSAAAEDDEEARAATLGMFDFWEMFVELVGAESPSGKEIQSFLRSGVNPYTGQKVSSL